MSSLDVSAAALAAPRKDALVLVAPDGKTETLTYGELAPRVTARCRRLEALAASAAQPRLAHPVLAETQLDAILDIYACLQAGRPALLQHPNWSKRQLDASSHLAESASLQPDDAFVLATSGSSSSPKYVVLERRALLAAALASQANLGWAPSGDRWLLNLPLAHVGGLSVLLRCLVARQTVVVAPTRLAPDDLGELLHAHAVTLLSLVPTQLARLLQESAFDLSPSVRAILVGGAPTSVDLRLAAKKRGWPILCTYGMTETASQIATERPLVDPRRLAADAPRAASAPKASADEPSSPRSCGPPLSGIEVNCEDGEIRVRGPALMRGYLGRPTPFDADGWFPTGDRGHFEANGVLVIEGRIDNVIISGGENVSPELVEAALSDLGPATQSCVVGVPDPEWGERVVALVTISSRAKQAAGVPDASASNSNSPAMLSTSAPHLVAPDITHAWRKQLRTTLPAYAVPREFRAVTQLPLLASGKVDRQAARALARLSLS